jgi:uncharacterized protein (DUF2126 family)
MKNTCSTIERIFREKGVVLTLGAEPTCVPVQPEGAEWSYTATGPTKLDYARKLARALLARDLRGGVVIFAPGKLYPGEVNPRWALHVIARRDGQALWPARRAKRAAGSADAARLLRALSADLGLSRAPQRLSDPLSRSAVWVLPLDHDGGRWSSPAWVWPPDAALLRAEGPAGLRLPWDLAEGKGVKRALTVDVVGGRLQVFLPPLRQESFVALLASIERSLPAGVGCDLAGYVPDDTAESWRGLVIAADPGVLEINLPPCADWAEYDGWLRILERVQKAAGLVTWKLGRDGRKAGTGGGHHLLFGGPTVEENPFFTRPGWIASILRFWQHHPSLSYAFTGTYVGSSSQAPRADESGKSLADLEMAYAWLEELPPGQDHRQRVTDTLIHLQSDASGNTHRSEASFDKFWNTRFPGGTRGLIEFRALESLPETRWASAVALLWLALAAHLLARPFRSALKDFGDALHDRFFLPTVLEADFAVVLAELSARDLPMDEKIFREIWNWRFPVLLQTPDGLLVRRALESWPLLCEAPLEGGSTSRFVDSSLERIELSADADFARRHEIRVNGRLLPLRAWKDGRMLAGLRYRSSAFYPSLHPGIPVQLPLILEIAGPGSTRRFVLRESPARFVNVKGARPADGPPCRRAHPSHFSSDLRLGELAG